MFRNPFFLPIFMITTFLSLEVALEIRAAIRGYDTLIFGVFNKSQELSVDLSKEGDFPFRSKQITQDEIYGQSVLVLSSSYAEASELPIEASFANKICKEAKICTSLNLSRASYDINRNIEDLRNIRSKWPIDFVLLYQMSNDIESILSTNGNQTETDNSSNDSTIGILRKTTLYNHIRTFITGYIYLNKNSKDGLNQNEISEFTERLSSFVEEVEASGGTPVLLTFYAKYDYQSTNSIDLSNKLQLVRYGSPLSPQGWYKAIYQLNNEIRRFSVENDVALIDIEKNIQKASYHFVDNFHFSPIGHNEISELISSEISKFMN